MLGETYSDLLTEREAAMAFNMGLKAAIYVLEVSEELSPKGRRYLVDQLKRQVVDSEVDYTLELIGAMPGESHRGSNLLSLKSRSRS